MQCLPLGILQLIYAQRVEKSDFMDSLSLITTWLMLGMKISKIGELPTLWRYQKKQRGKVDRLEAIRQASHGTSSERLTSEGCVPKQTRRNGLQTACIELDDMNN